MDKRDLYIRAALGDRAEKFFASEIGQYVIERSFTEIAELHKQFEETIDTEKWKEINLKIRIARKALGWLNDAINDGRMAFQQIELEDN